MPQRWRKAGDMNFLETINHGLQTNPKTVILQEPSQAGVRRATCDDLLAEVAAVRTFLRAAGLVRGDRVVLLASNSIDWAACDLAILSEGLIQVALYTRQDPQELAQMIEDCGAALILCGTAELREGLVATGKSMPRLEIIPELLSQKVVTEPATSTNGANGKSTKDNDSGHSMIVGSQEPPVILAEEDVVTIIYTSGTSGVSKGVVLTVANLNHMLPCTLGRLDELMAGFGEQEREQILVSLTAQVLDEVCLLVGVEHEDHRGALERAGRAHPLLLVSQGGGQGQGEGRFEGLEGALESRGSAVLELEVAVRHDDRAVRFGREDELAQHPAQVLPVQDDRELVQVVAPLHPEGLDRAGAGLRREAGHLVPWRGRQADHGTQRRGEEEPLGVHRPTAEGPARRASSPL